VPPHTCIRTVQTDRSKQTAVLQVGEERGGGGRGGWRGGERRLEGRGEEVGEERRWEVRSAGLIKSQAGMMQVGGGEEGGGELITA